MPEKIPLHLITRYLSNEATDEEQEQLLAWVSKDPDHQKIFQEYSERWEQKKHMHLTFDLAKGLRTLNSRIDTLEREAPKPWFTWSRLAAAVVLALVAGGAIVLSVALVKPGQEAVTYLEHSTLAGERMTIDLVDGSKVQLNAGASIRFPKKFEASQRQVYLTGEAFFRVAKDPSKPFIIHAGGITTTVLGTSFNVNARPGSISVAVATGKVSVSDGTHTEILLPEDKVVYNRDTRVMKRQVADLRQELAWTTNTLVFDDTDLLTVAGMLEQWYGVKVAFENESLKRCLMTGTFRNESLNHILEAIAFSTGIHYEQHNKAVKLTGKGCE
jgi:transmembrane sensor